MTSLQLGSLQSAPCCRRGMTTIKSKNPYRVLGLPPNVSFPTIQKKFLQLAMKHHPDMKSSLDGTNKSDTETFVQIRSAFEQLRKEHHWQQNDPRDVDKDEKKEDLLTEADFLEWFHQLTGVRLTSGQRREMVDLYWKQHQQSGGRQSQGHSWDLARRLVFLQDVFLRNRENVRTTSATRNDDANEDRTQTSEDARARSSNGKTNLRRKRPARR